MTGLTGVDPAVVEAAKGVGMTERQSLWQVEAPLAAPVAMAGVRTAAVLAIGTATLATDGRPDLARRLYLLGATDRELAPGAVRLRRLGGLGLHRRSAPRPDRNPGWRGVSAGASSSALAFSPPGFLLAARAVDRRRRQAAGLRPRREELLGGNISFPT